jgi:Zn-finger nucleic acid-binding protein
MIRCPVCQSNRVVVVVSPDPHAFCARCAAVWTQNGDVQRDVRPASQEEPPRRTLEDAGPIPWASA